jgi:hypothetical protein
MKYFFAIMTSLFISGSIFFLNPNAQIPMHFDLAGNPTSYAEKVSIFLNPIYVTLATFAFALAETNKKAREDQKRVLGYLYGIVMGYMIFSPVFNLYLSKMLTGSYQAISPIFILGIIIAFLIYFRKELKKTNDM